MAFINKDGLQHLTNKLVRAENIKVASLRGSTIKEVIDNIQRECDNIANPNTMVIENNVSNFKVGQGKNINVSNDIEDGISSFEFKGISYKNLCKDNVKYVSSNDEYFSFEDNNDFMKIIKKDSKSPTWGYWRNYRLNFNSLKPQTVYTLIVRIDCNYSDKIYPRAGIRYGDGRNVVADFSPLTKKGDYYIGKITTIQDFSSVSIDSNLVIYFSSMTPQKINDWVLVYKKMMLIEGDLTNNPINSFPGYFEGIKSSFEDSTINIEIKSPNLADITTDNRLESAKGNFSIANIEPGEYTLSLKRNNESIKYNLLLRVNGEYKNIEGAGGLSTSICSFTIKEKGILRMNAYTNNIDIWDIMLVKGKFNQLSMPSFVPYNIQIKTIDIKEPLRSLPNGTCDEIKNDNEATKLIRKITKINLNGSENWQILNYPPSQNNTHIQFSCVIQHLAFKEEIWQNNTLFLCDKLPCANDSLHWHGVGENGIGGDGSQIIITWKKTSAPFNDLSSFKLWLQQNNITLFLPLKEDKITQIESLQSVISQGATINLNSDIAPTSTHTVILNRSGQIEQGIELIAELRNKIDNLEREYDNNLLNTQLQINNLKLNLKLKGDK